MLKSMTGYGKGELETAGGRMIVEIRSVNHRYCEIGVKLPRKLMQFENDVKKGVAATIKRGKIEVFIQLDGVAASASRPVLNQHLAKSYFDLFDALKSSLSLADQVSIGLIAAQKDVITFGDIEADGENSAEELMVAVRRAVDTLEEMRTREGLELEADLLKRRGTLDSHIAAVARRAPHVVSEYAMKLKERVGQLVADSTVNEERLAQEVALMADRLDISEELVRFGSHMKQFDEALAGREPVGRKLDFLIQEINREVNTIGSKASDAEIATLVVTMKAELEKIREQVQNIE